MYRFLNSIFRGKGFFDGIFKFTYLCWISFFIFSFESLYVKNLNIYESMTRDKPAGAKRVRPRTTSEVRSTRSSLSFIFPLIMRQRRRDVRIVQFSRKRGRPLSSGRVSLKKHRANDADRSDKSIWQTVLSFDSPRAEGEPRSPFIKARGAYRIFLTAMKALSPGRAEVLRFTFN